MISAMLKARNFVRGKCGTFASQALDSQSLKTYLKYRLKTNTRAIV